MSKRISILALLLVFALLLCEFNLTVTDSSYSYVADLTSDSSEVQGQSLSSAASTGFVEFDTPEVIRGHNYGSLSSIRTRANGKASQRSGIRLLLLFVLILCLLRIVPRHLKYRLLLPEDATTSSRILFFIHCKDGKK